MFKKICSLTVLSFALVSSVVFSEIEYEINDIGTLQTRSSYAIALNNQGQILGWYNIEKTSPVKQFFVRNKDGVFYELPGKEPSSGLIINWQYLTDEGKAYGTFDVNASTKSICMWDQKNGFIKLGNLPGKEVCAVNNAGQVLIKCVSESLDGKSICRPVIWQNGHITKLKGLGGDLGIESEESYGFAMNNKGEVVGQSLVSLVYKNEIYKQVHAVKWTNGQAIDLHNRVPKSIKTHAFAINDLGEVLIYVGEKKEYFPKYLVSDQKVTAFSYDLNKLNNAGNVYNSDYDYGVPVKGTGFIIKDRNGKDLCSDGSVKNKIENNPNSIWITVSKIIQVNDNGEFIAQGETIYGEQHVMLLNPVKTK